MEIKTELEAVINRLERQINDQKMMEMNCRPGIFRRKRSYLKDLL